MARLRPEVVRGTCENCKETDRRLRFAWGQWWCDCCFDEIDWDYRRGNYRCTQGCCDYDQMGSGLFKGSYDEGDE